MITSFDHHTTKHKIPCTPCNLLPLDFFRKQEFPKRKIIDWQPFKESSQTGVTALPLISPHRP